MMAPRERGRPARTMPGTASAIPPHLDQPATAPWLSFGLAAAVTADVVAACKAARKLSDHHKGQHAGGTPALPGAITPPLEGEPQKPSRKAKADAVGGGAGSAPGNRYFFMNIDAQDAQDKQDEGLLRGELTPAMIRCGLADAQDYKPAVS